MRKLSIVEQQKVNCALFLILGSERDCNQNKRTSQNTNEKSFFVPCGSKLSNFIEDFGRIRKLKSFMEMKQFN